VVTVEVTQPEDRRDSLTRRAFEKLRDLTPGARALKTALAVGLAWWVGTLFGEPQPLFAALGALVGMEATVARSLRRTGLQLAGMLGGLVLAYVLAHTMGASPIAIALAVLLGLWLGRGVGSPDRVGVELGVTTMLVVVFAAGDPAFAATRIWETVLGGLIAAAINALILPPNYLGQVAEEVDTLVGETTSGLREATRIFVERAQHEGAVERLERLRETRGRLPDVRARLTLAESALRFSPLLRGRGERLERYQAAMRLYERAVHHATTLARAVAEHAERPHPWSHTELVGPSYLVPAAEALSLALERYQGYVRVGDASLFQDVGRDLARGEAYLDDFLTATQRERARETDAQRLVDIAAVASELEHLAADLATALESLLPYRKPEGRLATSETASSPRKDTESPTPAPGS
jgi:uncharacterized membrane protein YgaE (UPF0421/DUF939 family)